MLLDVVPSGGDGPWSSLRRESLKFLAEDDSIDLPKAGWKAYTVEQRSDRTVLKSL